MNREQKNTHVRTGSVLWRGLNRVTAWLYALIANSLIGRVLGGYRRASGAFESSRLYGLLYGEHKRSDRLLFRLRLRLAREMERSWIGRGLDVLFSSLMHCPRSSSAFAVLCFTATECGGLICGAVGMPIPITWR